MDLNNVNTYLNSLKQDHVCIGVTPLLHSIIAKVLSRIWKLNPETNIEIICALSSQIIQGISDSKMDVGIVLSTDYSKYKVKPLRISDSEKLVLVASPELPIAQKETVDWHDLENYSIICGPKGSPMYQFFIDKFRSAGIQNPPHLIVDTINIECVKIFAEEGNGIGFWHVNDVEGEVAAGRLKILPMPEDLLLHVDIIVSQNVKSLQPVIKEFIRDVKQELNIGS